MKIDFREIIKKRMKAKKIANATQLAAAVNNYWLAGELLKMKKKGTLPAKTQRITRQAIANYLKGKSEITSGNLELILEVLGVEI